MTATFTGQDAIEASLKFLIAQGSGLPADTQEHLAATISKGNGFQTLLTVTETLYRDREALNPTGLELLEGLSDFVARNNFGGMGGLDGRAAQVKAVARRVLDGGKAIDEAADPAPNERYAPKIKEPEREPVEIGVEDVAPVRERVQ